MTGARGRPTRIAIDGLLGQALHDPETGLPNAPFFSLIRDWEERRARRRQYRVRVLTIRVHGGTDQARRVLTWRLTQSLRASDLVASHGAEHLQVLLTSPDAEHADEIRSRIERLAGELEATVHPAGGPDADASAVAPPVAMDVAVEDERRRVAR